MKKVIFSPVFIFSGILKLFCFCVVGYEVYRATKKFLSNPVANVVYTVETELPMVTVCNELEEIKFGPMPIYHRDFRFKGQFYPINKEGHFTHISYHYNHYQR